MLSSLLLVVTLYIVDNLLYLLGMQLPFTRTGSQAGSAGRQQLAGNVKAAIYSTTYFRNVRSII